MEAFSTQISILQNANAKSSSYLSVIFGAEHVDESIFSSYQKHTIRQKCQLLCMALTHAQENMKGWQNEGWTWNKCCSEALEVGRKMGVTRVTNAHTIENWYRQFREKRSFIMPL
jgi:hypothetical protein